MCASENGHIECVEALLQKGAQANTQDKVSSSKAVRCVVCEFLRL